MARSGLVRIGTSGWMYKHWMGRFYPEKMPGKEQLAFYAERFDTVEINYSFYRLPERSVFESWRERTPPNFLFAVKGSRYLTHRKKLTEPEEPLGRLTSRAAGLGDKLGPILFQFPKSWTANLSRLEEFAQALTPYREQRFAFEFRHQTWLVPETYAILEKLNAALCLPVHPEMPSDVRLTADWTYIRMHNGREGWRFSDEELRTWADRIQGFAEKGADAYIYFNNDPDGHALVDAERLRSMLR
jgi:uncharacterized protein YecE (DUF72 family)